MQPKESKTNSHFKFQELKIEFGSKGSAIVKSKSFKKDFKIQFFHIYK